MPRKAFVNEPNYDTGHWAENAPGTGFAYRYSVCLVCGRITRSMNERPLIHNGRKPRKR